MHYTKCYLKKLWRSKLHTEFTFEAAEKQKVRNAVTARSALLPLVHSSPRTNIFEAAQAGSLMAVLEGCEHKNYRRNREKEPVQCNYRQFSTAVPGWLARFQISDSRYHFRFQNSKFSF